MTHYFIGIGGSGSKVLESLTHLCAAGLMPGDGTEELYVLGVDPDSGNGNLNRAKDTFDCYRSVTKLNFGQTDLFKTKASESQPTGYYFSPVRQGAKDLDAVLEAYKYDSEPAGLLYSVLYTEEERTTGLDIGFRGHPAIGAAVLANDLNDEVWREFIDKIKVEAKNNTVKIFLAGSIFGGTGAAGVPNIAKIMRNIFNKEQVGDNVIIGGGLVLPYFSAMPSDEEKENVGMCVTSADFIPNTQAALNYYYLKMKNEPMYNSLYLIGSEDSSKKIGVFSAGAQSQKNDAHVVDLYTAYAALDFFGRTPNPLNEAKCYYTGYDDSSVGWNDLPSPSGDKETDKRRFTQFLRFAMAYQELVRPNLAGLKSGALNSKAFTWYRNFEGKVSFDLHDTTFVDFQKYLDRFLEWSRQIGTRNSDLIEARVFKEDYRVHWDIFENCIGGEHSVTIDELKRAFTDAKCKDRGASDFGLILRTLYDSCKVRK